MKSEYGNDFITIIDENGDEFELEHLDTIEFEEKTYMAFLPADVDEDDDEFGIIILELVEEEGDDLLISVDDEDRLNRVYEYFMSKIIEDSAEEENA